jgi:hypothetical protein
MKLYDWKKQMKAVGLNPKEYEATKTREVPTGKGDLLEFLTFFGVDVYRTGDVKRPTTAAVDVDALRALHNPDGVRPSMLADTQTNDDRPAGAGADLANLAAMFASAPIRVQAELVVAFADRAVNNAS